jgi:hypothetical protein
MRPVFIALTLHDGGSTVYINTAAISAILPANGYTVIYFAGEAETLYAVVESAGLIMELIDKAHGGI